MGENEGIQIVFLKNEKNVKVVVNNHENQTSGSYIISSDEYYTFRIFGNLICNSEFGRLSLQAFKDFVFVMLEEVEESELIFHFDGCLNLQDVIVKECSVIGA